MGVSCSSRDLSALCSSAQVILYFVSHALSFLTHSKRFSEAKLLINPKNQFYFYELMLCFYFFDYFVLYEIIKL